MQHKNFRAPIFLSLLVALALLATPAARAQRGARFAGSSVRRAPMSYRSAGTSYRGRDYDGYAGFPSVGNFGYLGGVGAGESLATQAAINPATQIRLAFAERFLRNNGLFLGGGGYYLLDGGGAYVVPQEPADSDAPPQQPQPQVIVLQQAPAQQAQPAPAAEAQPALPDEGEFTLVMKDGQKIQAAAFTQMKDGIVYISPDGTRHTIALSDLDAAATERLNQERGTPLQLHL